VLIAVFIHEIRIRSAKSSRLIVLDPSRRNSPAKSRRLIVNNNEFADAGKFACKDSDNAPRMTTNNNEHQCAHRSIPAPMSGHAQIDAFDLIRSFVTALTRPISHSKIAWSCCRLRPAEALGA
jgi:hypothetical protein